MAIAPAGVNTEYVSFEDFMARAGDGKAEWVGGKVVTMSPVNRRHHEITTWLVSVFRALSDEIGGMAFHESFLIRDSRDEVARCPDLMFLKQENMGRLQNTILEGPADLIVEVVSPDSVGRDRGEKFVEYEALGVSEYWIIDPDRQVAEFYVLENGRYRLLGLTDGMFRSHTLPQVAVDPSWFWQERLPKVRQVLKGWGFE